MIARILVSIGAVGAAVGLVLYGMGTAYVDPDDSMINLGAGLMIAGVIATVVGAVIYRAQERSA